MKKAAILYFAASPEKATQKYLFRVKMDGNSKPEKLSPALTAGTHDYQVSPNGKYAFHKFSNHKTPDLRMNGSACLIIKDFADRTWWRMPLVNHPGKIPRLNTLP